MSSVGVIIDDKVTPGLNKVRSATQRQRLYRIAGYAAAQVLKEHFYRLDRERPNKLGGRRTHYYAGAGDSVHYTPVKQGVIVTATQIGLRLHYQGGTVRPARAKALTIPINPQAYGKRAREFDDLFIITTGTPGVAILAKKGSGRSFVIPLYLLLKSVTHQADPTILPPEREVILALDRHITRWINRHRN